MLSGATLVLTVISAVGIGVAAGWVVLSVILYAFSRRNTANVLKA
jgi:type III secretory pathway component EscU